LFFDENGGVTTEDTGRPILKNEPMLIYGIVPTIVAAAKLC
jgi:hypothetical protein